MGQPADRPRILTRRAWLTAAALSPLAAHIVGPVATAWGSVDRWPYEQQLGILRVHADFSLEPCAALLEEIGQLDQHLNRILEIPAPREAVHVVLFRQRSTYQAYLRQYYPRVPYRRALYIKDRGPGIVFACRGPELDVDVRHESTHALLHASQANLPLWLDEGLAEYFEVPAGQRAFGHEHLAATRWQTRNASAPRLEELEVLDDLNDMDQAEYQRAWAWVHFCLHGPGEARVELTKYLTDRAEGSTGTPLSDRLRRRWPDLDIRFLRHFRNWQ